MADRTSPLLDERSPLLNHPRRGSSPPAYTDLGADEEDDQARAGADQYEDPVHAEAHDVRAQSPTRWWILFGIYWSWAADYCLVFSLPSLEHSLLTELSLSVTQFSALVAVVTFLAIFGPFPAPKLIAKFGAYRILLVGNVLNLALQAVVVTGAAMDWYWLMLFARAGTGFIFGVHETVVVTIMMFWFKDSGVGVALGVAGTAISTGLLTARFVLPRLAAGWSLTVALAACLAFPVVAILGILLATRMRARFFADESVPERVRSHSQLTLQEDSWAEVKQFSTDTWLAVLLVGLSMALLITLDGGLVEPLVAVYGVTEARADEYVAVANGANLLLSTPVAMAFGALGYVSMALVLFIAGFVLCAVAFLEGLSALAVIIGFAVSLVLVPVMYTVAGMACAPAQQALMSATYVALGNMFACLLTQSFGALADYVSWPAAFVLILVAGAVNAAIGLIIAARDCARGGPLHKAAASPPHTPTLQEHMERL